MACSAGDDALGYSAGAFRQLTDLIGSAVPFNGAVLDIGSQDISGATHDDLRPLLTKVHGGRAAEVLEERFNSDPPWKLADVFRDSICRYASVDLYPGDSIIQADLNTYVVPEEYRGVFDLVTNMGTTEHILDQVNAFRCMHDFAKVGALLSHHVPATGYYNHGLFNYHPLFFVFMARANGYEVKAAGISAPHLEYTIPSSDALYGTQHWAGIRQSSSMLLFLLRKTRDEPFQLFSDLDQRIMGMKPNEDQWSEMIRNRYDLRVRG
jgi:hypothetical protein